MQDVFLENGISLLFFYLFFAQARGQGCVNLCIAPFFFFFPCELKGLVFFLADEQKAALCVSVISLPGLAAKLASAAPSVELALRSQCHTERASLPNKRKTGCVSVKLFSSVCVCVDG